jgi:hypothetical protein
MAPYRTYKIVIRTKADRVCVQIAEAITHSDSAEERARQAEKWAIFVYGSRFSPETHYYKATPL